jgi:hypothetical protein
MEKHWHIITPIEKRERRWESVTKVVRFRGENEFSKNHKEVKV